MFRSGQSLPQTTARGAACLSQQAETRVAPHPPSSPSKPSTPSTQQSPVKPVIVSQAGPQQAQARSQQTGSGVPPTRGLAGMSLDRKPVIHNSGEAGQP